MWVPGAGAGEVPDGCWARAIVETRRKLKNEKRSIASPRKRRQSPTSSSVLQKLDATEPPAVAGGFGWPNARLRVGRRAMLNVERSREKLASPHRPTGGRFRPFCRATQNPVLLLT